MDTLRVDFLGIEWGDRDLTRPDSDSPLFTLQDLAEPQSFSQILESNGLSPAVWRLPEDFELRVWGALWKLELFDLPPREFSWDDGGWLGVLPYAGIYYRSGPVNVVPDLRTWVHTFLGRVDRPRGESFRIRPVKSL